LSYCQPNKDFGKGFYVTKYYNQAKIWADRIGKLSSSAGYVTEFDFHEYAYGDEELRTLRFERYDDAWLDFVSYNRNKNNKVPHSYDIVEGPMADDRVSRRIELYLDGEIRVPRHPELDSGSPRERP
jgi:hypothetical protein